MSKLSHILSAVAGAAAIYFISPTNNFEQIAAQAPAPDTYAMKTAKCDEAHRGYIGAIATRGLMNTSAAADSLMDWNKIDAQASDRKYQRALMNNGIDGLTEAAAQVGMFCGATPQQLVAAAKARHTP